MTPLKTGVPLGFRLRMESSRDRNARIPERRGTGRQADPAFIEQSLMRLGRTLRRMKKMHIFEILRALGVLEVEQQANL
jgi:hypothetical protein